jgi:hypothetical protein
MPKMLAQKESGSYNASKIGSVSDLQTLGGVVILGRLLDGLTGLYHAGLLLFES